MVLNNMQPDGSFNYKYCRQNRLSPDYNEVRHIPLRAT